MAQHAILKPQTNIQTSRKVPPRYLSAARASLNTLSFAMYPDLSVPSVEDIHRIAMDKAKDPEIIPLLWSLLNMIIHSRQENWRHQFMNGKRSVDCSQCLNLRNDVNVVAKCRACLHQMGYRRPQFFGWSTPSRTEIEAKEIFLSIGWVIAKTDGFGLAREVAWSKRTRKLLPPYSGDIGSSEQDIEIQIQEISTLINPSESSPKSSSRSSPSSRSCPQSPLSIDYSHPPPPPPPPPRTIKDLSNLYLLKFGKLKASLRELNNLSTSRGKLLQSIDREQHNIAEMVDEDNSNHEDDIGRQKRQAQQRNLAYIPMSAKEIHILKSPDQLRAHLTALSKSCELAERLVESSELEPSFWKYLTSKITQNNPSLKNNLGEEEERSPYEIAVQSYEKLKNEVRSRQYLVDEFEKLHRELVLQMELETKVPKKNIVHQAHKEDQEEESVLNSAVITRIEQEVDLELHHLISPLMPSSSMSSSSSSSYLKQPLVQFDEVTNRDDHVLNSLMSQRQQQERTQTAVLEGALKLFQPHLPHEIKPMKFETVRQRKTRQKESHQQRHESQDQRQQHQRLQKQQQHRQPQQFVPQQQQYHER